MIKKLILFLFCLPAFVSAQMPASTGPEMADEFRSNGKIYVVISVIALIFLAIVAFLIYLERKVAKLERDSAKAQTTKDTGRH